MLRGYYTAASGIVSQEKRLNSIANNISNATKAGYKKDDVVFSTFGEHVAVRMNTYNQSRLHPIGGGVWMQTVDEKYTNYQQGGFDATGRTLDMAIQGEGFFIIAGEDGEPRLTRDGQFALDQEGYLVLPGFGRVQGQNGDLQIGVSDFVVSKNGTIFISGEDDEDEPQEVGRLAIAVPADYAALEKEASGLFIPEEYTLLEEGDRRGVVLQKIVERSNVNMSEEMTRMIATQRSLQSASQIVKMYDEMSNEANNRLSNVK